MKQLQTTDWPTRSVDWRAKQPFAVLNLLPFKVDFWPISHFVFPKLQRRRELEDTRNAWERACKEVKEVEIDSDLERESYYSSESEHDIENDDYSISSDRRSEVDGVDKEHEKDRERQRPFLGVLLKEVSVS